MRVAVRYEGGLGDVLLGNRFVPAIKEKYPDARITAFIDSEGKTFQKEALSIAYGHFYDEIKIIPSKKYKEFWVDCQFGLDNYKGAFENIPDDIQREIQSFPLWYDLHIDSLKWMNYDFDWLRYFYFFPRPNTIRQANDSLPSEYVVMHLHSATSKGHVLEGFYIDGLVREVSKFSPVVLISTKEDNHLYEHLKSDRVIVLNGDIEDVFSVISRAKAMVSTDSGFRYLAYGCSIPTITFSSHCFSPGQVLLSHQVRWLLYPQQCLPLNFDFLYVSNMVKNILDNKGVALIPLIENFDMQFVKRKYSINQERSQLR